MRKLRPVVQQPLIAYRSWKVETSSKVAMSSLPGMIRSPAQFYMTDRGVLVMDDSSGSASKPRTASKYGTCGTMPLWSSVPSWKDVGHRK